jgi:hypothetical protein
MENKQTAVAWLAEQMINQMGIRIQNTEIGIHLFDQAKEMEKEQNELTCINVIETILDKKEKNEIIDSKQIFEEYYEETYGGDND